MNNELEIILKTFDIQIGYAWAKDFNKSSLQDHFNRHGGDFDAKSKEEYAAKAVHFANTVDRKNYKSVKDYRSSTYKYDPRNGSYAVITKDGYVTTYFKPKKVDLHIIQRKENQYG